MLPPDLVSFFIDPAVALLFFMGVIILSGAALFMSFGQRMRGDHEFAAGRYAVASFFVMASWAALMGGAVIVLATGQASGAIMPPLDRAIGMIVALVVGWAFLTADRELPRVLPGLEPGWAETSEPPRSPLRVVISVGTLLAAAAIVVAYVLTTVEWYNGYVPTREFNASEFGIAWTVAGAVLAAVMLALITVRFRLTTDAPLKLLFFLIVLAGYGFTLYSVNTGALRGDESGAIRLAFMTAMLFFPVVVYRLVVERLSTTIEERAQEATVSTLTTISNNLIDTTVDRESVTLLKALGTIIEHEAPEDIPRQIVTAVATTVKADVTALLVMDDPDYADVIAAYDSVQGRAIAAMAFKMEEQPTLQAAVTDKQQRTLLADTGLNELVDVYTRLDIQKIGPVYFQPLVREGIIVGVLVVALPYTQRDLREGEKRLLETLSPVISRLLAISRASQRAVLAARGRAVQSITDEAQGDANGMVQSAALSASPSISAARAEMQSSLELARTQINELSGKVRELQIELDYERSRIADLAANDPEGLSISQRMDRISGERRQLEAERERLMNALQEAQTQLASASGDDDDVYETAIRILQQERDELQDQKVALEAQILELRSHGQATAPALLREMLNRLSEEKGRLSVERDQLKSKLDDVEAQLAGLGIEGGASGLVSTVVQLTEERSKHKFAAERAIMDRDILLGEMRKFRDRISREKQRDEQIAALELEIRRLAQDREVLMKQREVLSQGRNAEENERERVEIVQDRLRTEVEILRTDLQNMLNERNRAIAERNKLVEERAALLAERDRLAAGRTALQTERDQLLARLEGNREILQQLGADGVGALKSMIDDLTEERSELEHRLISAQTQTQRQREKLDEFQRKLIVLRQTKGSPVDNDTAAVLLSVAQELRGPLNAVGAYVDLLLGESVGILGELQRQFLERVKANGDRLAALIEDFVRVVAIDTGQLRLKMAPVPIGDIIDDAITATRTQFREKGITLQLELPDDLPGIEGDRGALQQIIVELLSNAYRASPTDGEVAVNAQLARGHAFPSFVSKNGTTTPGFTADGIAIAVQDWGGGVPVEDQSRVFTRFHRADKALIPGLGDTGVGLSIARALTEMHGGHMWLESVPRQSSIFRLVVPLHVPAPVAERPEQAEKTEDKAEHVPS